MKYAEIRRAVLELIDQSTIAGEDVSPSYNNQADYLRKIPALLNQAITKIRTTRLPKLLIAQLSEGEVNGAWVKYALPSDCRELVSGGIRLMGDCGPSPVPDDRYMILGSQLWLPAVRPPGCAACPPEEVPGMFYLVEYRAFPPQFPADPTEDFALDETPDVIQAAEYYAAAMLVIREDEYLHANLMNEYEARLAAMAPPLTAEVHPIADVYWPCACAV